MYWDIYKILGLHKCQTSQKLKANKTARIIFKFKTRGSWATMTDRVWKWKLKKKMAGTITILYPVHRKWQYELVCMQEFSLYMPYIMCSISSWDGRVLRCKKQEHQIRLDRNWLSKAILREKNILPLVTNWWLQNDRKNQSLKYTVAYMVFHIHISAEFQKAFNEANFKIPNPKKDEQCIS